MFSFFSRRTSKLPINLVPYSYDTSLSKYLIDTTNKIKADKDNLIVENIKLSDNQVIHQCDCSLLPFFSMISFLAGYYLSKYNM